MLKTLTIRTRLYAVTGAALLAFTVMAGVAWYSVKQVAETTSSAEALRLQLASVEKMRLANLEMVLAAMDSIIDRDEGQIQPERAEVIAASIEVLRANAAAAATTAAAIGRAELMQSFDADLEELSRAIQVDLKNLIETNAPIEEFAKLDDAIDGGGERITETLATLSADGGAALEKKLAYTESTSRLWGYAQIGAALLAILLIGPVMLLAVRTIVGTLGRLRHNMDDLAAGQQDIEVKDADRQDEFGAMARAVLVFQENARERARLEASRSQDEKSREARQSRIEGLISGFNDKVQSLLQAVAANVGQMDNSASTLNGVAEQTSQQATSASAATEEAAANVQSVATATDQLSASIGEITQQVTTTTEIVGQATKNASAAEQKIKTLADAAHKIGEVINLIQDIAEQTNLLALNATIEAARAGEMGKGFAVVASEVKTLANETGKATEEISQQIGAVQASTEEAVKAIAEIAESMTQVNEYTSGIAAAVEEQSASTGEISRNVQEAAKGTQEVSSSMTTVTSSIAETSQAAGQVAQASSDVAKQADALRSEIDKFLADVAAA